MPFVPPSSCVMWLKANAGALDSLGFPCTNGASVATWEDQSGNGSNAAQSDGGSQPTFAATAINSRPSVHANGDSQFMNATIPSATQQDVFVVARWTRADSYFPSYSGLLTIGFPLIVGNVGSANLYAGGDMGGTHFVDGVATNAWGNFADAHIVEWLESSASIYNEVKLFTDRTYGGRFWIGDISEVLAFSAPLDEVDHAAVQTYLYNKYFTTTPPVVAARLIHRNRSIGTGLGV